MDKIIVKSKPDNISWEELAELQRVAHQANKTKGVEMKCANYTGEELKDAVKGGKTYVAVDTIGNVMGMLSFVIKEASRWWHHGIAGYICYVAIAPDCQGKGIYKKLSSIAYEEIALQGVNTVYLNTHVNNIAAQKAYIKDGYHKVRFSPGSGTDYYSVEMVKWLDGKGKSALICKLVFLLTEIIVKMLYKPGKIRRF